MVSAMYRMTLPAVHHIFTCACMTHVYEYITHVRARNDRSAVPTQLALHEQVAGGISTPNAPRNHGAASFRATSLAGLHVRVGKLAICRDAACDANQVQQCSCVLDARRLQERSHGDSHASLKRPDP